MKRHTNTRLIAVVGALDNLAVLLAPLERGELRLALVRRLLLLLRGVAAAALVHAAGAAAEQQEAHHLALIVVPVLRRHHIAVHRVKLSVRCGSSQASSLVSCPSFACFVEVWDLRCFSCDDDDGTSLKLRFTCVHYGDGGSSAIRSFSMATIVEPSEMKARASECELKRSKFARSNSELTGSNSNFSELNFTILFARFLEAREKR